MKSDDIEFNYKQNNKKEDIQNFKIALEENNKDLKNILIVFIASILMLLVFILIVNYLWWLIKSIKTKRE